MNKKTFWLLSITIVLNLIIVRIPFEELLSVPDGSTGQLFNRLLQGALVFIGGVVVILYMGLRADAGFQIFRIRRLRPLWPLTLIVLCWLFFSRSDFQKANVSVIFMLFILSAAFLKASAEEIIFRGFFLAILLRKKLSPRRAILITSLLFSFMHLSNLFVFGDWVSLVNQLVFAFFIGLLFGVLTYTTGNILLSCILHTLMNLPFYFQQFALKQSVTKTPDLPVPGVGEGLLSILMFCVIFSPFFGLAIYYFLNRNWVPPTDSVG